MMMMMMMMMMIMMSLGTQKATEGRKCSQAQCQLTPRQAVVSES